LFYLNFFKYEVQNITGMLCNAWVTVSAKHLRKTLNFCTAIKA